MEKESENRRDETVAALDVDRYMGLWYELARFDHRFERGMGCVTAFYERRSDGRIAVTNSGYRNGCRKTARGKARVPDPSRPGRLKVSFFLWFYSDYYVLELSDDYSYALIGSRSDRYLWVLSRTPYLPEKTRNRLLDRARRRGYDTSKLIWTSQDQDECAGM